MLKDTHDLGFEFLEIHGEHRAARMEDKVAARRQQVEVTAQSLFHASLDAIALMSFAQHLSGGEANAWAVSSPRRKKPAHGGRLALAAGSIGAQIVSVLRQAHSAERLVLNRLESGGHGEAGRRFSRNIAIPARTERQAKASRGIRR